MNIITAYSPIAAALQLGNAGTDAAWSNPRTDDIVVSCIWTVGAFLEAASPGLAATAWVRLTDFAVPPSEGDRVTVAGKVYAVVRIEADGLGGATCYLRFVREVVA